MNGRITIQKPSQTLPYAETRQNHKSEHTMRLAKLSPAVARRMGLSSNVHFRVWCECQRQQKSEPGTFAGQHASVKRERTAQQAFDDPRALGGWDALGVVDVRDYGSALRLWRAHVRGDLA